MVNPNMYSEFVTYCKQKKGYTCLSTHKEYLDALHAEVVCPNFHIYSVRPYDFKKEAIAVYCVDLRIVIRNLKRFVKSITILVCHLL